MKIKKRVVRFLKAIFLFVVLIIFLIEIFQSIIGNLFRIQNVNCFNSVEMIPCSNDLWLKINGLTLGKNLLFLSPHKLRQEIKNKITGIEEVNVKKKLPRKIIIYLSKRKPIAVIETKGEYWGVDYQGIVVSKINQPTELPLIVTNESLLFFEGEKIESPSLLACIGCLYRLLFKSIEVYRLEIKNEEVGILYLKQGIEVLISLGKDLQAQVDSLQLILQRAKIEGKKIKKIDLRFDKPIISYG